MFDSTVLPAVLERTASTHRSCELFDGTFFVPFNDLFLVEYGELPLNRCSDCKCDV